MSKQRYVLVTAARNEAEHIRKVLASVTTQTIKPERWVIVSDGSTDATDEIVESFVEKFSFIELQRRTPDSDRNFGSKVKAIRSAMASLSEVEYDYLGNLDADVSFEPDYYERVLMRFEQNPRLGVASGILFDVFGLELRKQFHSKWSAAGPVQFFRRECYESFGGYRPLRRGGVDSIAEFLARLNGWEVCTFEDIHVHHHRPMGTAKSGLLAARYRQGLMEYSHGNHPLFQLAKCFLRIAERPLVIGAGLRWLGFCVGYVRREERAMEWDLIKRMRAEQMSRLRSVWSLPLSKSREVAPSERANGASPE